ncbi:hypothetical protein LJC00_02290 [Dysgonomonas sp. OttesenSCG-928-M03]|nr:hypothetical protein [Dysgonomonas sp. OttesenSCG-928-M03]
MKLKIFLEVVLIIFLVHCPIFTYSQVTIGSGNTPSEGAILDINTQQPNGDNVTSPKGGMLLPRVELSTLSSLHPFISDTLATAAYGQQKKLHTGLIVYNIKPNGVKNLTSGIYQWNGAKWVLQLNSENSSNPWYEVGTTSPATSNIKDAYLSAKAVVGGATIAKINNNEDATLTVTGGDASINEITVGKGKGAKAANTVVGDAALSANVSGDRATAIGYNSLKVMTAGNDNTAIGSTALGGLTSANNNTVIGSGAGSSLTTGSNNIVIGNNVQLSSASSSNQINIGGTIFGTVGSSTTTGKISIGSEAVPTSNLHIEGDMILDDVESVDGGEALIIGTDGKIGVGGLLPSPTLHTFYQSGTTLNLGSQASSFNNPAKGIVVPWNEASDGLSNNMTTFSSASNTFTFDGDYICKISGYVGFQFIYGNNDYPATTFSQIVSKNAGLAAAILEIQYDEDGTGTNWTAVATGHQVWYGAAIIITVKVIQVPTTIITVKKNSRLRMVVRKADSNMGIDISTYNAANIARPAGAKYCKGLTIVALK